MTLPTPAALTRGVQLRVIDYNEAELTAEADSAGTATASTAGTTDYLPQGQYLRIERIVVLSGSANTCRVTVYQGDTPIVQRGRDWTVLPPGDVAVAEYPALLTILPTGCVTIQVTGANDGDLFQIAVQYQLAQKVYL